jgi:hypothetical protein
LISLLVVLACLRIGIAYRITSGVFAALLLLFGCLLFISDAEDRQMMFKVNYADEKTNTLSRRWQPFYNVNMTYEGSFPYAGIEKGDTLLIMASRLGYRENVRFLLSKGADRKIRNKQGDTALDVARRNGHKEICRMLEKP